MENQNQPAAAPAPTASQTQAASPTAQSRGEYASFGTRFLAYYIDSLIIGFIATIIIFAFMITLGGIGLIIGYLLAFLMIPLYFIIIWTVQNGQTPGKKLLAIKIVRLDGKPLSFATALIRAIGYFVSGLIMDIGFLWVLWDPQKQALHDKMSSTVVVKTGSKSHTGIALALFILSLLSMFALVTLSIIGAAALFNNKDFQKGLQEGMNEAKQEQQLQELNSTTPKNTAVPYTNAAHNLSIIPPSGWKTEEGAAQGIIVMFTSPKEDITDSTPFSASMNIATQPAKGASLAALVSASKKELKTTVGATIENEQATALNRINAYRIDMTVGSGANTRKVMQVYLIENNNVYVVSAVALESKWDEYEPLFTDSLNSLTFSAE